MTEVLLRPNRRALWFAMLPAAAVGGIGLSLATGKITSDSDLWRWIGVAISGASLSILAMLAWQLRQPRVALRDGNVLFYLRRGGPIAVPMGTVEAFFLGSGPATLPAGIHSQQSTVNLVARLSQRETQWAQQEVNAALGRWCEGYVTIRGTWCEPLNGEVIRRLNRRLKEVQTNG